MGTKKAEEFLKNRGYTNRVPFPHSTVVNQMTDFAKEELDKSTASQEQTIERLREALQFFIDEFPNFLEKTNIGGSFYSGREIKFMNESLLKANAALNTT